MAAIIVLQWLESSELLGHAAILIQKNHVPFNEKGEQFFHNISWAR